MTTYKTYQEAKIYNSKSEIFTKCDIFQTINAPTPNHFVDGWKICKPADYCMTLADFFNEGHELVIGDTYESMFGDVITVLDGKYANERVDFNDCRYILRAKALEDVTSGTGGAPEKEDAIEWKNGDECEVFNEHAEWAKARYVAFDGGKGYHVVFTGGLLWYALDSDVRELESPEQKLERQRLESAYHLACIAGGVDRWGDEFTFDNFKSDWEAVKRWLAVIDAAKADSSAESL